MVNVKELEVKVGERGQASISAFDRLYVEHGVEVSWAKHPSSLLTGEFVGQLLASRQHPLVYDLGSGEGGKAFQIAGHGIRVVGFDASKNAVAIAQHQAQELGLNGQVSFDQRDITALAPTLMEQSDGVHDYQCITHIPKEEHRRVAHIVASLLRPGGVFLTNTFSKHTTNFYGEDISQLANGEFVFHFNATNPHHRGREHQDGMYCYFFTEEELVSLYSGDFTIIRMVEVPHPFIEGRLHWEVLMIKK